MEIGSLSKPMGGEGGLFFRYFSSSKETIRQFFTSLLSSQSFQHENIMFVFEENETRRRRRS